MISPLIHFILIPIHFIHIKGVWHALYVLGGHKGATPITMALAKFGFGVWQDGDGNSRL